ncbi:MAG TPA: hypothetical protein PLS90_09010 [Candidatus Sumerlaeota bacterium]|nr:hypothetical protein [Candidatus Sumerlaeota bacterium]
MVWSGTSKTALGARRAEIPPENEAEAARMRLRAAAGGVPVETCVRRRPWISLALALGAGVACGVSPALRRTAVTTAIALLRRCG